MLSFGSHFAVSFVVAVLGMSGVSHFLRFRGFIVTLRRHEIVPENLVVVSALAVVATELGLAGSLVVRPGIRASYLAVLALAVVYVLYVSRLLARGGAAPSCGCGPVEAPLTPASRIPSFALGVASAIGIAVAPFDGGGATPLVLAHLWGLVFAGLVFLLPASVPSQEAFS